MATYRRVRLRTPRVHLHWGLVAPAGAVGAVVSEGHPPGFTSVLFDAGQHVKAQADGQPLWDVLTTELELVRGYEQE